jgi:hypothetical protein
MKLEERISTLAYLATIINPFAYVFSFIHVLLKRARPFLCQQVNRPLKADTGQRERRETTEN